MPLVPQRLVFRISIKNNLTTILFLEFDYIDERDILWSKIVYEKIDLNEKLNFPLLFP